MVTFSPSLASQWTSLFNAIGQDSSVGRAADLHVRGPGFNTLPGLTQPSIPLWVGKMSIQQT